MPKKNSNYQRNIKKQISIANNIIYQSDTYKFSHYEFLFQSIHREIGNDFLNFYIDEFYSDIEEAIAKANNIEQINKFDFVVTNYIISKIFGPDWEGNCTKHEPFFWYDSLSEPQITKLLAYIFNSDKIEAKSFILAILKYLYSSNNDDNIKNDLEYIESESLYIEAESEKCIKDLTHNTTNRVDLYITWKCHGYNKHMLIEVKFNAHSQNNFEIYGNLKSDYYIFLIMNPYCEKEFKSHDKKWNIVYWQEILPIWEKYIKEYTKKLSKVSKRSSEIRRSILNKLYGV